MAVDTPALDLIRHQLEQLRFRALSRRDLENHFLAQANRMLLGIPSTVTADQLAKKLLEAKVLSEVRLKFPSRTHIRYLWNKPTPYEVAQSINRQGYFSHFSAMHLHGLTDQIPKTIYLNVEQRQSAGGGTIDQDALHRVFRRPCRVTRNVAAYDNVKIALLSGSNTGNLGVIQTSFPDAPGEMRVAGIERTLIDAAVRPVYSGGVFEVARAFRAAKGRTSIADLVKMLATIGYTYPFHQPIGFYLEREGYSASDVDRLRALPIEFDFYLDYGLRQTEYNSRWRLFIPKGF